ncbi:hypothetical protein K6N49_003243 [Salmonella enterica]|nr:hypothetical protein [Salmonella enterica]EIL6896655.1 hypothetical protein [Salmonella enterica]
MINHFLPSTMTVFDVIPVLKSTGDICVQNSLRSCNDVCMPEDTHGCTHLRIAQRWVDLVHQNPGTRCITGVIKAKNHLTHHESLLFADIARPAERFTPDNDALVVDETNNKTKGSICKAKNATKSSVLGRKNST